VKRALCVGINEYPMDGASLKGCVNDATSWAGLLADHFDFARSDVVSLTDRDATKAGMIAALGDLLAGASYGDVLVFTNSSHGSYQPDEDGDETSPYDEVLCPYDIEEHAIVDDELRELFDGLPRGVHLTVISDSCHSGNVTRVIVPEILPGYGSNDDRRVRFLSPLLWRGTDAAPRLLPDALSTPLSKPESFTQATMRHVLLSGCMDAEVSYDAMIDGRYHGAMSFHALKVIREANYEITYRQLAERLEPMVVNAGFPQHPRLEGRSDLKEKQIFT
jgi:hypothetical protein